MDHPIATLRSHLEQDFLFDGDGPRGRVTHPFGEKVVCERDRFANTFAAARKLKNIWLPTTARLYPDIHVDYATIEHGSYHSHIVREKLVPLKPKQADGDSGRHGKLVVKKILPAAVWRPRLWLGLLLGHIGLSVRWSKGLLQDALFIDVDLTDGGLPVTVELLSPALRAKVLSPVVEAIERLSDDTGVDLKPVYYSSGHSGYWVCLPLERPITRMHAQSWTEDIIGRARDADTGPYGVDYDFEIGNTFPRCVRVPFGPHEETGLPAVFLDPGTGEYPDQFEALMRIERSGIIPEEVLLGEGHRTGRDVPVGCGATSPHAGSSGWLDDDGTAADDDATSPVDDLDGPTGESATVTKAVAAVRRRPPAAGHDPFPDRPWYGLLPARIDPKTTHATLIDGGLLLRVEARLLHRGLLHWDGSWQPCLDDLIEDLLSLYPDHKPGRRSQIEHYLHCDLEKMRTGRWQGVDTTAGAIDAEEAERCRELAAEIVAGSSKIAVGDVAAVLIQLVRCHHVNAWYHRTPFWGRNTLAEWCGFIQPGATDTQVNSEGKRAGRIVHSIRQGSDDCVLPLVLRTKLGHSGEASEYRFLWENWGGVFAHYAVADAALDGQGGWQGTG